MAITVHTLQRPWIWAEAVPGGSLSPATYYFIGFNSFASSSSSGSYYGYSPGPASEQISVVTDSVNNRIRLEIYEQGGSISCFSDKGDSVHVTVTTACAHGKTNGDIVYVRGSLNYSGSHLISGVTAYSFDIVRTWVSNDGAAKWYAVPGLPSKPPLFAGDVYFVYKWDYYTMLRGDGSYVQWMNVNDTGEGITNEWYHFSASRSNTGHRRWMCTFYYAGLGEESFSVGADGERYLLLGSVVSDTGAHAPSTTILYENALTTGGGNIASHFAHPQISLQKYSDTAGTNTAYKLPDGMDENASAVLVNIDNSNGDNSWYHFILALEAASGVLGKSVIITYDGAVTVGTATVSRNAFFMRGMLSYQAVSSWTSQPNWFDKSIVFVHGRVAKNSGTVNALAVPIFTGCSLFFIPMGAAYWVGPTMCAPNSFVVSMGANIILDNVYTENTTVVAPKAFPNYYYSNSGTTFLGTKARGTNTARVMRNQTDGQYVRDSRFVLISCLTVISATTHITLYFNNCSWEQQPQSLYGYDAEIIQHPEGAAVGQTLSRAYIHKNSVTDRIGGILRIYFNMLNTGLTALSQISHVFYFDISIKVVDVCGAPIDGALVSVSNSALSPNEFTVISDMDGNALVTPSCYKIEFDPYDADGYRISSVSVTPLRSRTTVFNDLDITIKKRGYEPYSVKLFSVLRPQSLVFTLKPARIQIDQEASL